MKSSLVLAGGSEERHLAAAMGLDALAKEFLSSLDVGTGSRATYSRSLRQFTRWLEATGRSRQLNSLRREDILAFKEELLACKKSSCTVSTYLTAVRGFFQWLEGRKIYPNIAQGVKGAKKARGFRKDCLTEEQLREALAAMDTRSLVGLRDYAVFNLVARTGLRTIEVSRAQVADIRQEAGQAVLWIQGKGRDAKDDFSILTPEALKPIRAYLAARGAKDEQEPLFCSHSDKNKGQALTTRSLSRIIKGALRRIGLDDRRLTAHSLRHTAITLAVKGGATVEQAMYMARHADPRTTMIYFHNLSRLQNGAEMRVSF
jgi:integrase/recombinase XerC/integrase/recombinase XerD